MKKHAFGLVIAAGLLSSCGGGKKEDFDKATYLLSRGGGVNGLKAATLIEPHLAAGDIMTRMRAARIFAGGKINAAGLDGASFLPNLAHGQSQGNTVKLLKTVLISEVPGKLETESLTLEVLKKRGSLRKLIYWLEWRAFVAFEVPLLISPSRQATLLIARLIKNFAGKKKV